MVRSCFALSILLASLLGLLLAAGSAKCQSQAYNVSLCQIDDCNGGYRIGQITLIPFGQCLGDSGDESDSTLVDSAPDVASVGPATQPSDEAAAIDYRSGHDPVYDAAVYGEPQQAANDDEHQTDPPHVSSTHWSYGWDCKNDWLAEGDDPDDIQRPSDSGGSPVDQPNYDIRNDRYGYDNDGFEYDDYMPTYSADYDEYSSVVSDGSLDDSRDDVEGDFPDDDCQANSVRNDPRPVAPDNQWEYDDYDYAFDEEYDDYWSRDESATGDEPTSSVTDLVQSPCNDDDDLTSKIAGDVGDDEQLQYDELQYDCWCDPHCLDLNCPDPYGPVDSRSAPVMATSEKLAILLVARSLDRVASALEGLSRGLEQWAGENENNAGRSASAATAAASR